MTNLPKQYTLPIPPELLAWEGYIIDNGPKRAPAFPHCFTQHYAIRPQQDYEFEDIKTQIATALGDPAFSDWTITYNDYDVEWQADYHDDTRTNEYGDGPFKLSVLINLYWDHQTNKHIVQVRAIQRSGEIAVGRPFEEHLETLFGIQYPYLESRTYTVHSDTL